MTSRKAALPLACLLALWCGGCGQILSHFAAKSPYAKGIWTGRLIAVPVRDNEGQKHEAAALEIETGPRTLRGSFDEYTLGTEDAPYLAPAGVGIVDPAELGIPAGTRVRVRGRMIAHTAGVDVIEVPGKPKVFRGVRRIGEAPPDGALVIQMRGKPKVLKERESGQSDQ